MPIQRSDLNLRNALNVLFLTLITAAKLMILAMVIIIGTMVFMRYVMGMGIRWANQTALFLQVWFTFIAMALGVRKRLHISINLMPAGLPSSINWVLSKLHHIVIAGIGLVLVIYGRELVISTMRSVIPAMGIRSGFLYLALPVGGALIFLEAMVDFLGIERRDSWLDPYIGEDEEIPEEDVKRTQSELIAGGGEGQTVNSDRKEEERG